MSELKARIGEAVKDAMRAGDKPRLATLRMVSAAIKQKEVDSRESLDDAAVLAVLDKMVKQRRESLAQYRDAGRDDLADREQAELDIIAEFLPQPLRDDELDALIDEAVSATGAASQRDMGKVMGQLKPRVQGRADMGAVSARVKARLGG
ncbi:GatB/YqeY domain-containing protein [Spiribacter halobius]|uniref:Glutamyl-tRNA amidotransferase n=1 Tax=Sediminicurvatus halobius TaxID=2182432 RepID=A0A2U2N6V8_9GAMM|nr:GatB/YqeY domain-containing protein [Spiribacter halobius]PWG64926.1 glutamyl-tRNA amidotransferase [Spiribacter halobius]UEX78217.1 GatB/YqeY domain-containing protein [Spiribacter halobius]